MADLSSLLGRLGASTIGAAVVQLRLDTAQYQREMATAKGQTAQGAETMGSPCGAGSRCAEEADQLLVRTGEMTR